MKVPFVDLLKQQDAIRKEILDGFESVLKETSFILGKQVASFESQFASYCDCEFGVGVANGTDAIHVAVRAAGIGPGDEVLIPANTFIATAVGVSMAGATPVPVDVEEATFNIDPARIEEAITTKTKAIIPVHLFGRLAPMEDVNLLAQKHDLMVIEDSAQAHGAVRNGKKAGSFGSMACFSFYPGKNLGAYGDAGGVTTNDKVLAERLRDIRNYGSSKKYHHPIFGFNSRLDTLQAVVLLAKLPHLDSYNNARRKIAQQYNNRLADVGDLILPEVPSDGSHVFHLYVVRTRRREELLKYLSENGVGTGIHYPTPIHLHGAYQELGYSKGAFPIAERLCDEIISLPMFPEMNESQVDTVVQTVKKFYQ